jgi:hypothetical protein
MTDRLTADCSTAELLRNMLLYSQQRDLSTKILVSVARIELALHAPKARVIPFHYTEKTGSICWVRTNLFRLTAGGTHQEY